MANRRINKKKMVEMATGVVAKTEKVAHDVAEAAVDAAQTAAENIEEQMNKPEVADAKEEIKENAEKAKERVKTAVKAARTKVVDTNLEFDGISVSVAAVEKAVKKDAAAKGLKGDIAIYLNINEQTAYYTVNGEGSDEQKVAFAEA